MRGVAAWIALALCAVASLCAAPAAVASATVPEPLAEAVRLRRELGIVDPSLAPLGISGRGPIDQLELQNGDGYELTVLGYGQTVMLAVHRFGADPLVTTVYVVHGRVTPTSIEASFGERGRISVRFQPSGGALRLAAGHACAGPRGAVVARFGVFAGVLRFDGEGGYTSARAHRVKGSALDPSALSACLRGLGRHRAAGLMPAGLAAVPPGVRTHPFGRPRTTTLFADGKLPLARTFFLAQASRSGRAMFAAAAESSEGAIGIVRLALIAAPGPTFAFDDALSLSGVTPPPPFRGSATFLHAPGGPPAWSGSLDVSFLGAPDVPLTGPTFKAQLVRSW